MQSRISNWLRIILMAFSLSVLSLSTPAYAEQLKAGIAHTQQLNADAAFAAKGQWFEVPEWLAGQWEALDRLQVRDCDERKKSVDERSVSLNEHRRIAFGMQRDAKRSIWHYGWELTSKADESSKKQSISESNSISVPGEHFGVRVLHQATTRNQQGKLTDYAASEEICEYSQIDPDLVLEDCDIREFDRDGFSLRTRRLISVFRRSKEFEPQDRREDTDLHALFSRYLSDKGWIDRVPN